MNNKNPFPMLYHAQHLKFKEDIPFWKSLARWQGNPILELGCGTGRILIPLANTGHNVYGLDNDPEMLTFLEQQISLKNQDNIHIIESDMTNFKIDNHFRLIIMPCNTYSTFDSESRKKMLNCIYNHLSPDGVFGFSMPNPNLLRAIEKASFGSNLESTFSHPKTGYPVQVSSQWKRKESVVSFIWHYDHLLPNGKVERFTASSTHHLTSVEEYITEILTAGFRVRSIYRNFKASPYKPDSNYLIILAQK